MKPVLTGLFVSCLFASSALAFQGDAGAFENRLQKLEADNKRLNASLEAVTKQMETQQHADVMPQVGDSMYGMGPAASKIYQKEQGLSIGGYGEAVYKDQAGPGNAQADFLRAILYFGYKFDENWVLNTEIEVEHADEVYVEFAYLEYLGFDALNVRAGMLLMPMGHVNEMHEPTTFRGPSRPSTESRIIPTTWRENGVGVVGDAGEFSYKLYAVNGLDAYDGFSASGLRGGRQKGSKAKAEDIAVVGRLDYNAGNGLDLGASLYHGGSGQGAAMLPDVKTTIFDVHSQYKRGGLRLRGLYAQANLENTYALSMANGEVIGKEQTGWYLEAGYDIASMIAPSCTHQVIPFVRYEDIDTHASVAEGLTRDMAQGDSVVTLGVDWKPVPNIVFKTAFMDWDEGADSLELSMGYVF